MLYLVVKLRLRHIQIAKVNFGATTKKGEFVRRILNFLKQSAFGRSNFDSCPGDFFVFDH
jgi:hypothetical protein